MQARAAAIVQSVRDDPVDYYQRYGISLSHAIATHADPDAFLQALVHAARHDNYNVVYCLQDCIQDVTGYEDFSLIARLRAFRQRAFFRAG